MGLWLLGMTTGSSTQQPHIRSLGRPQAPTGSVASVLRVLRLEVLMVYGALEVLHAVRASRSAVSEARGAQWNDREGALPSDARVLLGHTW